MIIYTVNNHILLTVSFLAQQFWTRSGLKLWKALIGRGVVHVLVANHRCFRHRLTADLFYRRELHENPTHPTIGAYAQWMNTGGRLEAADKYCALQAEFALIGMAHRQSLVQAVGRPQLYKIVRP